MSVRSCRVKRKQVSGRKGGGCASAVCTVTQTSPFPAVRASLTRQACPTEAYMLSTSLFTRPSENVSVIFSRNKYVTAFGTDSRSCSRTICMY